MEKSPLSRPSNPAQIRGDIQAGLTGDKRPGFDPALVPLETDAEAAGTPLSAQEIEMARETQSQDKIVYVSGDSGSAMRPIFPANRSLQSRIPLVAIVAGFVGIVLVVAAFWIGFWLL